MWSGFLTRGGAGLGGVDRRVSAVGGGPHTRAPGWTCGAPGSLLAGLAGIALAASQLATIAGRRAPGMTLLRMPVFTWSMLVTCLMTVASFPALVLAMGLLLADRHGAGVFDSAGGPGRLPESVLVLRAPGRLRDVLPVPRRGAGGGGDLLAPARLRLPRDRRLAARLHRAVDERVGPSHVHHRAGGQRLLLADLDACWPSRPASSTWR